MKAWQKIFIALVVPGGIAGLAIHELVKYKRERRELEAERIQDMINVCVGCSDCLKALKHGAGVYLQYHLVQTHDCSLAYAQAVTHAMLKLYTKQKENK